MSSLEPALYQDIREVETTIVNRDRGAFLTASDLPDIPKDTYLHASQPILFPKSRFE